MMENLVTLMRPGFTRQEEEEDRSSGKLEDTHKIWQRIPPDLQAESAC